MKNVWKLTLLGAVLLTAACSTPIPQDLELAAADLPEVIDFNIHIKPLLSDRCFKCHGPDANQRKANLRLDLADDAYAKTQSELSTKSHVIKPHQLGKSEVFRRLISENTDIVMPPPASNLSLTAKEKALIAKWIKQGAAYKPHWAFIKPEKAEVPILKNKNWAANEIDNFIGDKIEQQGLPLGKMADKETLLRRATLDLTGLPPTIEEIDDFLNDNTPNAYEKVVDRLLASSHYGEQMARPWLDVARYADSHGYQDDGMRTTWPWRAWVIRQFNENKPYDDFLIEQIAGDLLPNPTKDQLLATCFNRNHPQTQEGGVVNEEYRVEYVADRVNTLGKAIMGLSTECARCHDHKYDPISQREYFSLFAFFNNNNESGIVPYNGEASPTILLPTPEEVLKLQDIQAQIEPLKKKLVSKNYKEDFKKWLDGKKNEIDLKKGLLADFGFDGDVVIDRSKLDLDGKKNPGWAGIGKEGDIVAYTNRVKNKPDAALFGDKDKVPLIVEGKVDSAVQFLGDAGIRFNRDLDFDRHQQFSVSVWIKVLKNGESGPLFNDTNGDFEGRRGWLCFLNEDKTLSFQLNHVYPDNGIDFKTKDTIATNQWTHIAMTYNGTSKASGVKFYINGKTPDYELLTNNLHKSLQHGKEGSNWSSFPFMVGRDVGASVENIAMDELKVYNRILSSIEIAYLFNPEKASKPNEIDWLEYYLWSGENEEYNEYFQELTALREEENLLLTDVLEVMVMNERATPRPTFVLDRGAYDAPTVEVQPTTPAVFPRLKSEQNNRLDLAKWLVGEEHPLTARVAVNRFWMQCFGTGIVATQEDFGNQGQLPTHPALLDWLAVDFQENGWDVKRLMKKIVLSSTYRQSSIPGEVAKAQDPENKWYSYFPSYRLSAETIRDAALAASGLLVDSIGGPSVYPYQPKGIWKALATRNATVYQQGEGDDLYRRSIYTIWKRSAPPPSMINFDAPDRYYCVVNRQKTSTPLQLLVLMNDPQFVEAARMLGERMEKETTRQTANKMDFAFRLLIGRSPSEVEVTTLEELYDEQVAFFKNNKTQALELLSIGEYQRDKTLNASIIAANTVVASTIMNFDEFVMKR